MSNASPYSSLIIGLGQIGMGYDLHLDPAKYAYTHARAVSLHPDFDLIAAVDTSIEKRDIFTEQYGCPAYESLENALLHHTPKIIVISVPTSEHLSVINEVLNKASPLAILCEKPLAHTLEQGRKIVKLCTQGSVELYVNYMRRALPGVREIKERIDVGNIRLPIKGVVWYSKGFLHNGSHYFNLLEYWLGEFRNVQIIDKGRELEGIGAEPHVHVTFSNGEVSFIPAWEEHYSHYTVELISPTGRLYWGQGNLVWQNARPDPLFDSYNKLSPSGEHIDAGMDRYQWHVMERLASALSGCNNSICTGQQALITLKAMHNILSQSKA